MAVRKSCPACWGRGFVLAGIPGVGEYVMGLLGVADPRSKAFTKCPDCRGKGFIWEAWRYVPRPRR